MSVDRIICEGVHYALSRHVRRLLSTATKWRAFYSSCRPTIWTLKQHGLQNSHIRASEAQGSTAARVEKRGVEDIADAKTVLQRKGSLWLRDNCTCSICVDPSTTQKLFQTCDLPINVKAEIIEETKTLFRVRWKNDLPDLGAKHVSTYQKSVIVPHVKAPVQEFNKFATRLWDKIRMEEKMDPVDYATYLVSDASVLAVLERLKAYGLVLLRGLPPSENAVELVASRIGGLKETFYGRTWDVRSVPQAKNVAYTNSYLGFHMDLLYMSDPPGLQMLHCLKNTCKGGTSMFVDGFKAAQAMKDAEQSQYKVLSTHPQTFHYRNSGEHYRSEKPVIQEGRKQRIECVNWSPPFQGVFEGTHSFAREFRLYVQAAKAFARHIRAPENIYEYRMQEGDCVVFNNRRILHARQEFDTTSGERWLKGAYIDTDVSNSRFRGLLEEVWKTESGNDA